MQPGKVLHEHYLKPMDMSASALAKQGDVPASGMNEIVLKRRGVTGHAVLRWGPFSGGNAPSWLNLHSMRSLLKAQLNQAAQVYVMQVHPMAPHTA